MSGFISAAFLAAAVLAFPASAWASITNGESGTDVLGEFNSVSVDTTADFTNGCTNNGGSTIGFDFGADLFQTYYLYGGVALDLTNHYLFVGDTLNNRVVVFALNTNNTINSKTPSYVLGQPDFTSCVSNQGGSASAATMNAPIGLAADSADQLLFVADSGNNRVLIFSTASMSNGMNASNEFGQPSGTAFTSTTSATSISRLYSPQDVAYDSTNHRLFVADWDNSRVMVFSTSSIANGENASNELGQPSGTAFTSSTDATTISGMNSPAGLAFDTSGQRLFVSDYFSNRVLVFSTSSIANGENASNVLLQSGFTGSGTGDTQSSGEGPTGLAYDSVNNRLFVSDTANDRVLAFSTSSITNGENASAVLCDSNYTTDNYGIGQASCDITRGLALDTGNTKLYVADAQNNRVMQFSTSSITNGENAADLLGQYTSLTSTATVSWTKGGANNGPTALGLNTNALELATVGATNGDNSDLASNCYNNAGTTVSIPGGSMDIDLVNHRLFVADTNNSRVLVYGLNTDNSFSTSSGGHTADNVLGRANFTTGASDCPAGIAGMCSPLDLVYDSVNNRLFVSDAGDARVLVYNTSSITNGMNASYELGQSNFTASDACNRGGSASQKDLCCPTGLALDSTNNNLYVADTTNNRVMVFNVATGSIANDENAAYVLGQASYTASGAGHTQSTLDLPEGLAYDGINGRLFVGDQVNNRVVVFNTSSIASSENASYVLGQTSFTNHSANKGGSAGQATLDWPYGVAYDPNASRLFVGDSLNQRVLVFDARPGYISNGENASFVLGQSSFTSTGTNVTQSGFGNPFESGNDPDNSALYIPYGPGMLRYSPGTNNVYVVDPNNNRIMMFDGSYAGGSPSQWIPDYN